MSAQDGKLLEIPLEEIGARTRVLLDESLSKLIPFEDTAVAIAAHRQLVKALGDLAVKCVVTAVGQCMADRAD